MTEPADCGSLEETLDVLLDDELVASILRSRQEAARGERLRLRDDL